MKTLQNREMERLKKALEPVLQNLRDGQVLIGPVLNYPRIEGGNIRGFVLAYFDRNEGFRFVHCAARNELDRGKIRQMLEALGVQVERCESDLELARACERRWPCAETRRLVGEIEREVVEREAARIEHVRLQAAADLVLSVYREDRPIAVAKRPGVMVMSTST